MISEQLKKEAYDFLEQVESAARDEGSQSAKKDFDEKVAAMQADFDKQLALTREVYYNMGREEAKEAEPVPQESVILADGDEYRNDKPRQVASFSYSRKFTTTKWGTIMLPVVMNYSDWSSKFEIAEISGVSVGDTITPVRKVLGWGTQTLPNHPYQIRAKTANTSKVQGITVKGCYLYPSEAGSVEIVKNGKKYTFKGSYVKMSADELKGKYYSSGGVFVKAKSVLNPMRVYLEITE